MIREINARPYGLLGLIFWLSFTVFAQNNGVPSIKIDPKGHSARINHILYTPDAEKIISISEDKTIRVWDSESGESLFKVEGQISEGYGGMLYAAALSPNGKLLAVAGYPVAGVEQNYILVIDLDRKLQVARAEGHTNVINSLEFTEDGKQLISSGDDGMIKVWRVDRSSNYRELASLNVGFPISDMSLNPKTRQLAVVAQSRDIRVYDFSEAAAGKFPLKTWKKHKGDVNKVEFSPDGKYLASTSLNNELAIWKSDGALLVMKEDFPVPLNALTFSYDSKVLVGLDLSGKGYSYAIPSGNLYTQDFKGHDNVVFTAAFSPKSLDGNYVVASAGGTRNQIVLWNAISAKKVKTITGQGNFIGNLAFDKGLNLYISTDFPSEKPEYEISFDLNTMLLQPNPGSMQLKPSINRKLQVASDLLTLELPKGSVIQNDEYSDGYIRSYTQTPTGDVVVGSDFSLKMYDVNGNLLKEFLGHKGGIWSLAASPDGRYIASGSDDQTIILWKTDERGAAPSMVKYFEGEEDIQGLLVSLEADSLITTDSRKAWEGAISLIEEYYGRKTARIFQEQYENLGEVVMPFANLFVSSDNEWVCWVPSGYFACSAGGADYFGWHLNNGIAELADYYSADQYFEILFRPQLISKSMARAQRAKEILKEEGEVIFDLGKLSKPSAGFFNINDLTIGSGKVLDYEKGKYLTTTHRLPLKVDIYDGGGGIREVNIYHNGKLIVNDTEMKSLQAEKKKTKVYEVELLNDLNNFRLVVVNYQGIESRPDYLKVQYEGEQLVTTKLHILAIGINEYEKEEYRLNYAKPDAASFVSKFVDNSSTLFKNIRNKIELYDAQASKENIMKAFESISSQADPEDMFVFYYAGHGTVDEENGNEYYLVPPNVTELYGDSKELQERGISATELKQMLSKVKATKQLILMDACHSGAAIETIATKEESQRQRAITRLARSSGVAMMTSTNSQQFATEFEVLQHGVFTYSLLDALDGAADTGDDQVSVYELKLYMERVVPQLSKQYGGDSQRPIAHVFGNDFPIAIVKKEIPEEKNEEEEESKNKEQGNGKEGGNK